MVLGSVLAGTPLALCARVSPPHSTNRHAPPTPFTLFTPARVTVNGFKKFMIGHTIQCACASRPKPLDCAEGGEGRGSGRGDAQCRLTGVLGSDAAADSDTA